MTILGIKNRTENWKTARYFAPFVKSDSARAALAQRLDKSADTPGRDIRIELFWKGVRDYLKMEQVKARELSDDFTQRYRILFCNLREEISDFRGFHTLKDWNYDASVKYPTRVGKPTESDKLSDNLENTEIDIVLQTPEHLFIGETKGVSDLGTESKYVLVHQIIRQYVMARILVDLIHSDKIVVPFVVGNAGKIASLKSTDQVKFMLSKGWIKKQNVLSWNEIDELAKAGPSPHRPSRRDSRTRTGH